MTGKPYGTLGPACADTDTLRALLRAGMRGVRLNLSHGPLAERAPWLESLRRAETAEGVSCDLLIDLQGPELRVGALFAPLTLREGDTLTLGEAFPVPPILTGNLQDGDELLLDDGALSLRVLDARAMTCRVERGDARFDLKAAEKAVLAQYGEDAYASLPRNNPAAALALGGLLSYLHETQKSDLSYISDLEYYEQGRFMELDLSARRNLELTETIRGKEKRGGLL